VWCSMEMDRRDQKKLRMDISRCVSLIKMYSEITDSRGKEMPKAQLYHLITALIGLKLWSGETTFSRIYNIHGAIPMVNFIDSSNRRKTTLLDAVKYSADPKAIEITKKGKNTFFKVGELGRYDQDNWTSEEKRTIREIISLRERFGSQTYAILGLAKPLYIKSSVSWLEKQAIDSLKKCTKAFVESKGKSEVNRRLRDCAKFVKSALDKIKAYREKCPQIKKYFERKRMILPIDLSFSDLEFLEREFCLKREEISELRHIVFLKFGIGRSDRDRSHIYDIGNLGETDISNFFEYVELALSKEETSALEKYLDIQMNEAFSEFDKNIFKLLFAIAQNVRYCNE
jgi:hypothetical protein